MNWCRFARPQVGHPLSVEVVAGFVNTLAAIFVETANDRADPDDAGPDRVEMLVLGGELGILHVTLDRAREELEVIGDRFERVVDFMGEADRDFACGGELLALAHAADIGGGTNRADLLALVVIDDRPGGHDRDRLAVFILENSFEVGDTPGLARLAHRRHYAARLFDRRIDSENLLADHLLPAVMQVGACAVVVINDGAVGIDRDDHIGRALDEPLNIFLIEENHCARALRPAPAKPHQLRARGRNFGSQTSSLIFSNVTSTGIPTRIASGSTPTRLETNLTPSSSLTTTTAYGTSVANPGW